MTQLRKEGWIHHLARHAVACFLTRGDLYLSWEEVRKRDFGPLDLKNDHVTKTRSGQMQGKHSKKVRCLTGRKGL